MEGTSWFADLSKVCHGPIHRFSFNGAASGKCSVGKGAVCYKIIRELRRTSQLWGVEVRIRGHMGLSTLRSLQVETLDGDDQCAL